MQRLDEAKRSAILQAAQQRLGQYGVRKTTMKEIAGDVGIAVGTLYLYFKNKNEIIVAVAESYSCQHIERTEQILSSAQPVPDKLRDYLCDRFRAVKESRQRGSHAAELARAVLKLNPELQATQNMAVKNNVFVLLQAGIQQQIFSIQNLERTLEVFLYSIGYFYPIPTTEQYYEPEEEKLLMVIDWFIEQWMTS